jgi:hypothetical protein
VVVLEDLPREVAVRRHQYPKALNLVLLFSVTFGLGYLGWILPGAGGSLAIPTLIVFGIGCSVAVGWWIVVRHWAGVVSVIAITIATSLWTFAFSLPASLTWGSDATVRAQTALARLDSSPKVNGTVQPQCSDVETGSVGPIAAPYRQCAVFTPAGHSVFFLAAGQTTRGLGYTDRASATFLDECIRHLVGGWWMFTADASGEGNCPIGYHFHGGP